MFERRASQTARQRIVTTHGSRAISRLGSTSPKDYEFECFVFFNEVNYPVWWSCKRLINWLCGIGDHALWNSVLCITTMVALLQVAADIDHFSSTNQIIDIHYNVMYGIHFTFTTYDKCRDAVSRTIDISVYDVLRFVVDVISYEHYFNVFFPPFSRRPMKLVCYYLRLHTPFGYLWALSGALNLKGSMAGMTLKYFFFFIILRISFALVWIGVAEIESGPVVPAAMATKPNMTAVRFMLSSFEEHFGIKSGSETSKFIYALYIINMMFLPLGPTVEPHNDEERVVSLIIMLTGSLVVTGAAVASLALVISLYMRPEEEFRARFRLIMNEMESVPMNLREKVKTFYKMYWHKERAVSETQLLPIFPPTLPSAIYTDIYFEAQQKSQILRDVSYQFLWEVSKCMVTIHYIPGDVIIKRMSDKSSIIYITYGDIEMLTPEDDDTAILRMTRGTIISSCGGCPAVACGKSEVEIRAATYCTAQVLTAPNLWKIAVKYGKANGQSYIMLASFEDHLEKVMRHFSRRVRQPCKYKSSILQLKRNLMALKEAKDDKGNLLLARSDYFLELARTYVMRNRADSSLTDEADEICLRPTFPCILRPDSSMLVTWEILMSIIILTVTFTHPYHLIFLKDVPLKFRFFDYFISGLFLVDIYIHLSTGEKVEQGIAITFVQISMQQMRSWWFIMDVISILPFFEIIGDGKLAGINKLLRIPKVFRILKSMEDKFVYHSNVLRFMSYTLLTVIASYIVASLQQTYMCMKLNMCVVKTFTQQPAWVKEPLDTDTVENRLIYGLFWGVSSFTFTTYRIDHWYSDYWTNVVYTIILLEWCVILDTFMEAMYSATILVTSAMRKNFEATIQDVKLFLITNRVDPLLRHRFITYLKLCWHSDMAYSITHKKNSIFFDLPPHVSQEIVSKQRLNYILCVPFMKYLNSEELKAVSSKSRFYHTSPNEILQNTGDVGSEIFVIKKGFCEIFDPTTQKPVCIIGKKDYFGVLECLLRVPVYYSVRAVTHVQVFSIPTKTLHDALKIPRIKSAIQFCKLQPEYKHIQVRKEPFLKYTYPPPIPNLCRFPLLKKHEPDTAFIEPFNRLGFWSILRYIFPRFTIRPDGHYIYRYEWYRAFCALIAAMVYPSYSYMVLEYQWLSWVTMYLTLMALFDIVQRCLVAYYNTDGILISHPSITAAHYLQGAFIIDLVACLPLEKLEHDLHDKTFTADGVKLNPIHQILMFNRLIQMYRVPGAMDILSTFFEREDIILVIKAIPFFMILNNVLACLMVFSSVDIYGPSATEPWRIVPKDDPGGSWVTLFKHRFHFNITESPTNLQLTVYSWIVYETTNTGRDLFQPSNINLLIILFIGIILGTMMTTYFSVEIISMRANVNTLLASYQENLLDISRYMKKENLNPQLQKDVLAYYEYNWDNTGGIDSRNVLKLCDQITLRTDAILHLYGKTFTKCPILCTSESRLLRVVGRAVHCLHFLKGTRIIEVDDVLTFIYFVHHGIVEVGNVEGQIAELPRGSVFGNMENVHALRSPTYIQALTNSHILQINSKMLHAIIADFPKVKELLTKHRAQHENYIIGDIGETCHSVALKQSLSAQTVAETSIDQKHVHIVSKFNITYNIYFLRYLIVVSLISVFVESYYAFFHTLIDDKKLFIEFLLNMDVLFLVKLVVNILLPHFVPSSHKGALMLSRREYLKTEFKYDFLSILPTDLLWLISYFSDYHHLVRLNRMFRIYTLSTCLQRRPQTISTNLILYATVSVTIWFCLFIHITTGVFYSIGAREKYFKTNTSWLFNDVGQPACDNHFICSYYFIMTTFTHKGVGGTALIPRQKSELYFVTILEIVSAMMYMIYVGEFSNIIQFQSFRSFGYYIKYLELQDFLNNNSVSKNLVKLVSRYSLHLWRETRGVQIPYFLETAPPCFKLKLMSAVYMQHLLQHDVFQKCEPAFLRQLVGTLVLYNYREGNYLSANIDMKILSLDLNNMLVVKEGEITNAMHLIHTGNVIEYDEDNEEVAQKFGTGGHFGLMQGLIRDTPYAYSYKTISKAEVLTLALDDWEYLLELFPYSRYNIYKDYPDHPYSKNPDEEDEYKDPNTDLFMSSQPSQQSVKIPTQVSATNVASTINLISEVKSSDKVPVDDSKDAKDKSISDVVPSPLLSRQSTAVRENVAKNAAAQMLAATTTIHKDSPNLEEPTEQELLELVKHKSVKIDETTTIFPEITDLLTKVLNSATRLASHTPDLDSDITSRHPSLATLVKPSDNTLVEKSELQSTSTTTTLKTESQATIRPFTLPAGPSLADIGTPVKLDNVMWPLDSRRVTHDEIGETFESSLSESSIHERTKPVSDKYEKIKHIDKDDSHNDVKELIKEVTEEDSDTNLQKGKSSLKRKLKTEEPIQNDEDESNKTSMMKKRTVAFEEKVENLPETEKNKSIKRKLSGLINPFRRLSHALSHEDVKNIPSTSKHPPATATSIDKDVTSASTSKGIVIKDDDEEQEQKTKHTEDNKQAI